MWVIGRKATRMVGEFTTLPLGLCTMGCGRGIRSMARMESLNSRTRTGMWEAGKMGKWTEKVIFLLVLIDYISGVYYYANGDVYDGDFKENNKTGYGTFSASTGEIYKGEILETSRNGIGTLHFTNGDIYKGAFIMDRREGHGKYIWKSGGVYDGQWFNDKMHGEGVFINTQGK